VARKYSDGHDGKKYALMHRTEDDMYTCSATNMKESRLIGHVIRMYVCQWYIRSVVALVA